MILLQANHIAKYFGAEQILTDVKLEIQTGDRIALVGRNGAGKSTLLKILAGQLSGDGGEIIKPKETAVGYLDQHAGLNPDATLWEEMLSVFKHLQIMEKKLRELERQMADEKVLADGKSYEKVMAEYDRLHHAFQEAGGYQYEAEIRSILHGLKFRDDPKRVKVATLSGGQKTRLAMGKLLLAKPDVLILDEPTNHLDMETLTWLEQYLQTYPGAILIVSHDRYFLDKIVNQVLELADGRLTKYIGNYSQYVIQRQENYERALKRYEQQQEQIERMKDFIQRNIARASTTRRAQSRKKALEKMPRMERPKDAGKTARFSFDINRQSGNEVLTVKNLQIGYGERTVAEGIRFRLTRGESAAIIGPNGIGKSTLLKTIAGKLAPLKGEILLGTNVEIGYYDQEQTELHSNKDVLHELWDENPFMKEKEIRTVLGNFLFSGDDVFKPVAALSGGEKARLALAKLMLKKANFLVLDEPTNHLDLESKEVLENALMDFPGTILFVSHDRYFINRMATKIFELSETGFREYLGDYDYYLMKKEEEARSGQPEAPDKGKGAPSRGEGRIPEKDYFMEKEAKKLERKRIRRIEEIQKRIEELEREIAEKERQLLDPEIYNDPKKSAEILNGIDSAKKQVDRYLDEWEKLEDPAD